MSSGPELRAARMRARVTLAALAAEAGWSDRAVPSMIESRVTVTSKTSARYLAALERVLRAREEAAS